METVSGSVTSTKKFVWNSLELSEERDASGSTVSSFFARGQAIGGLAFFIGRTLIGSISEMTNSSAGIQAQYAFDPFGRSTKLQGSLDADFQYAGYYKHQRSGLNLTFSRAYSSSFGRWLCRDFIAEGAGSNLFAYVKNMPVTYSDPLGFAFNYQGEGNITNADSPNVTQPIDASGLAAGGIIIGTGGIVIHIPLFPPPPPPPPPLPPPPSPPFPPGWEPKTRDECIQFVFKWWRSAWQEGKATQQDFSNCVPFI